MSVQAWANAVRRDQYRQSFEDQRAIDTIRALLEGSVTPDAAADTISSLYEPLIKRGLHPSPVATLWGILCDAVRVLGGDKELSERLIDLLNSISQLPDVTDEEGNAITPEWKSAGVYWRDLPELAIIFREYGIGNLFHEQTSSWRTTLLNATTFGAMHLARGKQPVGMSFHAEISLMQGIEVPYQTSEQQGRGVMNVPPAATWILLAGEKIHELCKSDHDRKDGAPGSVPANEWLWGKGRGFSVGRWELWQKRFGEIAGTQGLRDDVRDLAARANSEMERIESQIL